jgi:hypothetical protein
MPLCKLSTCNLSGPNVLSTPANFSDFISSLICSDSLRGIQGTQGIEGRQGPAGGGSTLQVYNLEVKTTEVLADGMANWGTKEFISTTNVLGSNQFFFRYDSNNRPLNFSLQNGDNDGDCLFNFVIFAKDVTNNVEYVLASYERHTAGRGSFSLSNQVFISPSKTTIDYYIPVSTLTSDASGNYFIINGNGNTDTPTNFTLLGSLSSTRNTIFKYNGTVGTGTGSVIKVTRADMLIINNYYVIKLAGSVNWTAIGSSDSTPGTLFKYNGTTITNGSTGCCLETTDLDLTNKIIGIRASGISVWGGDTYYTGQSLISCLSITSLSSLTETTYAARAQSSIGSNVNQLIEYGYNIRQTPYQGLPYGNTLTRSEYPLVFQ